MVIATIGVPLGGCLAGLTLRDGRPALAGADTAHVRPLLTLGIVMMATTLLGSLTFFVIRMAITRAGGVEEAGYYQAAYSISAMNVSLVLAAMAADYFPRLSALPPEDRRGTRVLVNQQVRAALLLGGPLLVGLMGGASLAIAILFAPGFRPATDILQWQIVGDLLKFPGWALGYVLVARGRMGLYVAAELLFAAAAVLLTLILLPRVGTEGAGMAYAGAYAIYSAALLLIVGRVIGAGLDRSNFKLLGIVLAAVAATMLASERHEYVGLAVGALLASALALASRRQLRTLLHR
jgi:PST family polysaccharide transporter